MPEKRNKYDRQFRQGAVRIVNETSSPSGHNQHPSSGASRAAVSHAAHAQR